MFCTYNCITRSCVLVGLAVAVLVTTGAAADQATPSDGTKQEIRSAEMVVADQPVVSFAEAVKQLTSVYEIKLNEFSQVVQNSYAWSGVQDASLACEVGFTPEMVVVRGSFLDDVPFVQPYRDPAMAEWWRIGYGGDGIEFAFDNPTSAAQRVVFVLNWGAQAVEPRVERIASALGNRHEFVSGAFLQLSDNGKGVAGGDKAVHFDAAVPISMLGDPALFNGPLRITVKMHDLDGGPDTYHVLQQVIEKK